MEKKLKLFLGICIALLSEKGMNAQHQADIWYFGYGAGLDFSNGSPQAISGGMVNAYEGCATACHPATGQLLFYTDGIYVWDKNHNVMPNGAGLYGDNYSSASALIIPQPGSNSTLFYIFTASGASASGIPLNSLHYSVVDMSLNGGNGDITQKNQFLLSSTCEKLTGIYQCNGSDIWAIAHLLNSNSFYAYPVTGAGIGTPVISSAGAVQTSGKGYMKASPNGKKIGLVANAYGDGIVELYDFDNYTGIVSNAISLPPDNCNYGASFSPDNTKFYVTGFETCGDEKLYQYDLSSGNSTAIISSKTLIASDTWFGAMQIAPDGKIYVALDFNTSLGVINNPNASGTACSYASPGFSLGSTQSSHGLPYFIESYFNQEQPLGDSLWFCETPVTLDAGNGTSFLWSTGDTDSTIQVTTGGTYWVEITNTLCNYTLVDTVHLEILTPPLVNLGNDTSACEDSLQLNAGNPGFNFLWSTGETNQVIAADSSGMYWVKVFKGNCMVYDTMQMTINPYSPFSLPDTSFCVLPGGLTAGNSGCTYLWSTGETTREIQVNDTGQYWVNISNGICNFSDTIQAGFGFFAYDNLGPDTAIECAGSLMLDAGNPGMNYYWSTSETTQTITVYEAGYYQVTVYDSTYTCSDTFGIAVSWEGLPTDFLGPDTTLCADSLVLNSANNTGYYYYYWSTGEQTPAITVDSSGYYSVEIYDSTFFCYTTFDINVVFSSSLDIDLGNDTSVCPRQTVMLDAGYPGGAYLWNTGDTTKTIAVSAAGIYFVQVNSNDCQGMDNIVVSLLPAPEVTIGNDTSICPGQTLLLNAGNTGSSYQWNTGDTAQTITVSDGIYWVEVSNNTCTGSDSILITHGIQPVVDLGNDTVICTPPFLLTASNSNPGLIYLWSNGDTIQTIHADSSGTFWVNVTSGNCTGADTIVVMYGNIPVIHASSDTTIPYDSGIQIAATGGSSYLWSTGETTSGITVKPLSASTYFVTVTDSSGCSNVDTIHITVSEAQYSISIPTIFSPNNDGINDLIRVHGYGVKEYHLTLYERWGEVVYEELNSPNSYGALKSASWDGTFNSSPLNASVFVFTLEGSFMNGETFLKNGNITLIR